jgi:hypothetical protein
MPLNRFVEIGVVKAPKRSFTRPEAIGRRMNID